jgi:hypothetical protein
VHNTRFKYIALAILLATLATTSSTAFAYKGGYTQQDVNYAKQLRSQGESAKGIMSKGISQKNWRPYTAIKVIYEGLGFSAEETFTAAKSNRIKCNYIGRSLAQLKMATHEWYRIFNIMFNDGQCTLEGIADATGDWAIGNGTGPGPKRYYLFLDMLSKKYSMPVVVDQFLRIFDKPNISPANLAQWLKNKKGYSANQAGSTMTAPHHGGNYYQCSQTFDGIVVAYRMKKSDAISALPTSYCPHKDIAMVLLKGKDLCDWGRKNNQKILSCLKSTLTQKRSLTINKK